MEGIVVTGVGIVSPLGVGPAHWRSAANGDSGIRPLAWPAAGGAAGGAVAAFDPTAYLPKKGLRQLNRAIVFARVGAHLALLHSRLTGQQLDPSRVGVVLGTNGSCTGQMLDFERSAAAGLADPLAFPNTGLSAPACQISIFEGYHCQTSTFSSGRAAGVDAVAAAVQILRDHEADVVIAGGVEDLCEETFTALRHGGDSRPADPGTAMWPGPFCDAGAVKGEGCACVILERELDARARGAALLAEIRATAAVFDPGAYRNGPDSSSMVDVMRAALATAGVTAGQIDAVITGADGDRDHDAAETAALVELFGAGGVPVVALCGSLGDSDGAQGAFQIAAAAMALTDGQLAGYAPRRHASLDLVHGPRTTPLRACLVTTFGRTGERVAMVMTAVN